MLTDTEFDEPDIRPEDIGDEEFPGQVSPLDRPPLGFRYARHAGIDILQQRLVALGDGNMPLIAVERIIEAKSESVAQPHSTRLNGINT